MLMADIVEVVIIRVLGHPPVEVRPCQDILQSQNQQFDKASIDITYHGILLILDGFDGNFSKEIIVEKMSGKV